MKNKSLINHFDLCISGNFAGFIQDVSGIEHVLIIGVFSFSMDGTGSADTIWNIPAKKYQSRMCVPKMYNFRYEIDEYGFVHLIMHGAKDMYFVITQSQQGSESQLSVLELQGISGEQAADRANIMLANLKRIPDGVHYSDTSLNGLYAGFGSGLEGLRAAAISYTMLQGDGTGKEQSICNLPSTDNLSKRQLYHESSNVSYMIDVSGLGRAQVNQGDGQQFEVWFVVTEVIQKNNKYLASEIYTMQTELDPISGSLMSGYMRLVYK